MKSPSGQCPDRVQARFATTQPQLCCQSHRRPSKTTSGLLHPAFRKHLVDCSATKFPSKRSDKLYPELPMLWCLRFIFLLVPMRLLCLILQLSLKAAVTIHFTASMIVASLKAQYLLNLLLD